MLIALVERNLRNVDLIEIDNTQNTYSSTSSHASSCCIPAKSIVRGLHHILLD